MNTTNKNQSLIFPSAITFKTIFRNEVFPTESIRSILSEYDIAADLTSRESRNGKFLSLTINATFSSKEALDSVCNKISLIEGFIMMF